MATSINFNDIFEKMVAAGKESLHTNWATIKDLATSSYKTLAQNIVDIEKMNIAGTITKEQAKLKIGIQKNAFTTILLTEQGLGLLAVEAALNASLNVIKDLVNSAVGFLLI